MIVSRKIAEMFKHCGFVNIDYLVENKLETDPSKILNILNRDWRKWVKPLCMRDGGDPIFGYDTMGSQRTGCTFDGLWGSLFTMGAEDGTADSMTTAVASGSGSAFDQPMKLAIYLHSDLSLVGGTEELVNPLTTTPTWYTHNFNAPKPSVSANMDYLLMNFFDYVSTLNIIYDDGATDQRHIVFQTYNGFPDPLGTVYHGNQKSSIYCTYTTAAPPPPVVEENPLISRPLISSMKVGKPIIR